MDDVLLWSHEDEDEDEDDDEDEDEDEDEDGIQRAKEMLIVISWML